MPKLLKIVFTFKLHPLHANISTPTGTPVPDENVKELSSIDRRAFSLHPQCLREEIVNFSFLTLLLKDVPFKVKVSVKGPLLGMYGGNGTIRGIVKFFIVT